MTPPCPSLAYVYECVDRPLLAVLTEMETVGVRIDVPHFKALGQRLDVRRDVLVAELHALADTADPKFLNSPLQLAAFIFDDLDLPTGKVHKKNPKGRSTNAENLERLRGLHPFTDKLMEYRKLERMKTSYVDKMPRFVDQDDRIHATVNNTDVETGRLSMKNPSLHNIVNPKKVKPGTPPYIVELGAEIRKGFVARPGWVIVKYDQAAVEWRIIVCLSNETSEIEAINTGKDPHCATAADWLQVPYGDFYTRYKSGDKDAKSNREIAKTVKYRTGYGGTVDGLVEWFAGQGRIVSLAQAQFINDAIIKPPVREWIRLEQARAVFNGYTETYYGRRIHNADLKSPVKWQREKGLREGINAIVQGSAADFKKVADRRIWDRMRANKMSGRFLLMVHDESVLECPEAEVDDLVAIIEKEAVGVVDFQVPLSIETGTGPSWGECE